MKLPPITRVDQATPQRLQLRRTKGWRKPEGAIVVARQSKWGNPFDVSVYGRERAIALYDDLVHGFWTPTTVGDHDVLVAYRLRGAWLRRINGHPLELVRSELAGHDLACWCPLDKPCHADVLLEVANS